jgi:hypothetical protein
MRLLLAILLFLLHIIKLALILYRSYICIHDLKLIFTSGFFYALIDVNLPLDLFMLGSPISVQAIDSYYDIYM